MPAPKEILDLVKRYESHQEEYKSGKYNEETLRQEFLNPFFEVLGWDVTNKQGHAFNYRDVIMEHGLKAGQTTKAPDYTFRAGNALKFFVEAKKPSVDIDHDPGPAIQLRSYAWSAKLPVSILTDFEELAVYNCRVRPREGDRATVARLEYWTYKDYAEKWDEIAAIFSKDAVLKGSFDKYAEDAKKKKGTLEVDDAFLEEIEKWRTDLAKNLAVNNSKLSQHELNFAVQRTIDRIIFLRICEDRGMENAGHLQALLNGNRIYAHLLEHFQHADTKYNSGLFHFDKEKGREEEPDTLSLTLKIDDETLKDIISDLYPPKSPYRFSVLPADILGQVYEQFLGKVIRLTEGHHARVEEKPEVKKAGGVYYTPKYIVDYIVKNTVGKLLEGKTPTEAAKLRILDPACGSGSFLIGAYQYLLDWHLAWYINDGPVKHKKELYKGQDGEWKLDLDVRKKILINNIYGVDIDSQAVEVTKLSLLLKVLEGEYQPALIQQRMLPDLGSNIKCGNSLIGPDFYQGQQMGLLEGEDKYRINAFDWNTEFKGIMASGGFDAVIGNPPYGAQFLSRLEPYLMAKYPHTNKDLDTYSLFIEKSIHLCRPDGRISMIVPTGWYSGAKFSKLRRFVACATDFILFINLPYDIFKAWVDSTIFVTSKRSEILMWPRKSQCKVKIRTFPKRYKIKSELEIDQDMRSVDVVEWFSEISDEYLTYADNDKTLLLKKIQASSKPLGELADIQRGVTPYILTSKKQGPTYEPAFDGTVRRYIFGKGATCFIRFDESLAEPKPIKYFKGPRILLRELISRQFCLQAVMVKDNFVTNKSMQSILPIEGGMDLGFLLGLINSRLMSWYFLSRSQVGQRDDFPKIVLKETRSLPIPRIDLKNEKDKDQHNEIIAHVLKMIELQKQVVKQQTDSEITFIKRQIDATEKAIDKLVYELYGLTVEDVKVIEGGSVEQN